MILTEKVKVKIFNSNIRYYKNNIPDIKSGDIIEVGISDLPKKSNIKIVIKCDICDIEKDCIYSAYNRYISNSPDGLYRCIKCNDSLRKKTLKDKYGCENYTNVVKYKKTMIEKYGGHCNKLDKFKDKAKNTCIEKYGCEYPMQSDIIKDKYINTMINKYGVKYPLLNDDILKASKNTMFNRYGFEYSMQISNIKDKIVESSKKSKINKLLNNNSEIVRIDYNIDNYLCYCNICDSEYDISPHMFTMRKKYKTILCTNCNPIIDRKSGQESNLYQFISLNYSGEIVQSYRDGLEIDIYLPELKIGFEFNGLYWHSENFKDKNYHLNKTNYFKDRGIQIIHIWEDDWIFKQDIIKSIILNKLGKSNTIFARKCEIKYPTNKEVSDFLIKNHIQGFVGSKIKLGLYHNDVLVSLMTFGNLRKSLGQLSECGKYELLRFCNKLNTSVVGGASKLFKHFIGRYNPSEVISYSDISRGSGNLYKQLGFSFVHNSSPGYYWVKDGIKYNRFNFRKDKLIKDGYDPNKTEFDIMTNRGYYRIFDCGSSKFIYNQKKPF